MRHHRPNPVGSVRPTSGPSNSLPAAFSRFEKPALGRIARERRARSRNVRAPRRGVQAAAPARRRPPGRTGAEPFPAGDGEEFRQAAFGPVALGDGNGAIQRDDRRWRHDHQVIVERDE